jgi:EF hand
MKLTHACSALALLFGMGAIGASLPAHAAGDTMVLAQAGGGGGAGGGGAGGTGGSGSTGGGQSGESGAEHPLAVSPATPTLALECDVDGDGFVNVDEARVCDTQRFSDLAGEGDSLTEELFATGMADSTTDPSATFAEIDADGDGEVSQEEWLLWREQGFAAATEGTGGRMAVDDYGRWDLGED